MEIEKKRSKGSFLSFFDWNVKSRKKLFSDNPNLPEVSKQGKENLENVPKSQLNKMNVHDSGGNPSNIASCDVNYASSVNSDEGCGTQAPGLVARLMGLDSLPASTVSELSLSSTSLYGSNSLGSSHSHEGDDLHLMDDYYPMDYINMPLKVEKSSLVVMESKAHKVGTKRFQSEMLPPKSAKPIPVAHNELLSPVKSHGCIPPKNAVRVKADTKINEASSLPYMRNRMSSVGPSSVPVKNLDPTVKSESAQYVPKLVDQHTPNQGSDKSSEESNDLYKSTSTFKGSRDPVNNGSRHIVSKGKSVSLPTLSKGSVQRRATSILNGNRGYLKQKEKNKIKQNKLSMSQKKTTADQARVMQRKACTGNTSNVLVQNNEKQICVTNKGNSTSKMDSNKPTRTWSSESFTGSKKTTNYGAVNANIEPKRSRTMVTDTQKEFPVSKRKIISENKRYISRDVQNEARGSDNAAKFFDSMSIKCFVTTDGSIDQGAFNMKESKDVVSFTFTSPLRRSMPESPSSTEQLMETKNGIDINSLDHSDKLYPKEISLSPRSDIIDGNDISSLLDKKLQELTSRINSSQCTLATEGSSSGLRSSLEDKFHSLVSAIAREHDRSFHPHLLGNELDNMYENGCSSSHNLVLKIYQKQQTSEPMKWPSCCSSGESGNDLGSPHSRAVTDFDNPFVNGSYLDREDIDTYGSSVYCSMQSEEVSNSSLINEYALLENEVKWYEKSSSTAPGGNTTIKELMSILVDFTRSTWKIELEYVKDILTNAELMAEEFVVGQTDKIITPNLFDVLENRSNETENYNKEYSKLERKVLFDTISECLELRCRKAFVGSCKGWPIWMASVKRKSRLAGELYKEVLRFKNVEEETMVVDELVSKDMSIGLGTWLDFDIEAFQEGLDVELDIVTYLINEIVVDLLCV
ncbi:hypothetical protein TanjilG_15620 [Lupinus angustifolius]|uniref:uncharacterized protein LOC109335043 n=1 Tax=Lupinus angustifolius TaxID=3871 RepID=UPI00090D0F5C|nr:PREDICTED: uncharacterized protein LOC109335043 [Lupinus angustifolius]OIV90887.1 hypothetical protein TanjilG_15620 [Lupinus angustifolius]